MLRCFFAVLFLFFIQGCTAPIEQGGADKVRVQLKFKHQAQFAGLYWALEKGYYQEENLEVEFIEGGRGIDLVAPVVSGEAQFGIASSDLILARRSEGIPVTAIAAIYRRSAATYVSRKGSGIVRPHDMVGKKVAVYSKNAKEYEFQLKAMLTRLNLDISQIELVDLDHQYEKFITGEVDITGAYVTGGALRLENKGVKLNYIWPSDYGIDFYSDTLFVNDSLLENDSDLILRFLRATLKGWNGAIRNSEQAVDITIKFAAIKDKKLQTAMMDAQHPLIYTGEDHIGWMSKRVWSGMNTILFDQGVIDTPITDINSVYTMRFLNSIYGNNE